MPGVSVTLVEEGSLGRVSVDASAKNMQAVCKAKEQHDKTCPWGGTGTEVHMNWFDIERIGWEEGDVICGLVVVGDETVATGMMRVTCDAEGDGGGRSEEEEVETVEAVAAERELQPVGPRLQPEPQLTTALALLASALLLRRGAAVVRRALFAATLALAAAPAAASAETELNVIPHGQQEPGVAWAGAAGMLPANAQALMYDRLTPLGRNVTDATLAPSADGTGYFKSAKLLDPDDPSLITDETITAAGRAAPTVTARIRRDAYGVPHIYSDIGRRRDRRRGLRHRRRIATCCSTRRATTASPARSTSPAPRRSSSSSASTSTSRRRRCRRRVARQQERSLRKAGADGRRVLRDIDTYLVGINQWYGAEPARARGPSTARTSSPLNAIKAQFLGEGGGDEIPNALFLDTARDDLGKQGGHARLPGPAHARRPGDVDDDAAPRAAPDERPGEAAQGPRAAGEGLVPVRRRDAAGRRRVGRRGRRRGVARTSEASNVLLVDGERSATGTPIMVGGPQIGYNYPGLTMEIGLYGPTLRARGATSVPFPGYMLIGRGAGLRLDAHLRRRGHHRHVRRAALRRLAHEVRVQGQVPEDEDGQRRHDRQGRRQREGALPPDRARAGRRLRPGGGEQAPASRSPRSARAGPRDDGPDLLPAALDRAA